MTDWRRMAERIRDLRVDGDVVSVDLGRGRTHRVAVSVYAEHIELRGVVARPAALRAAHEPVLAAWLRNRAPRLVGFRFDERDRLIGEAWVPLAGLQAPELNVYLRAVAAECDLFEFQLTGSDRE